MEMADMKMMPEWQCRDGDDASMLYTVQKQWFLNDFTFSTYSVSWSPGGEFWITFWCLLVTLGPLFRIFESLGDRREI
jgi:hypothetical protein